MFNNPKHFLHEHLSFLESTSIYGKDDGLENFFAEIGITYNKHWDKVRTVIDWTLINEKYKFFYDYEGEEELIKNWLAQSKIKEYEFLYTWFAYDDPIVKVKTIDFINNWEEFVIAGVEALAFTTEHGELFFEFTGSSNYDLWSNFEIKPNSLVQQV